jgi:hypothetical protein
MELITCNNCDETRHYARTAPSPGTDLVSNAATVAGWGTLIVVAPSLLQRMRMVRTKLGATLEAKPHGVPVEEKGGR